ncbi:hypothetical protein D068_cds16150 [Bacillus atrophaeus UCMB-5137]|nr:hypothetical protein D068_cds16150 [Bacillus atrophaeus UCMB-5137]
MKQALWPVFFIFINPIKKLGLTFVRIVLKFNTNLKNLSRAAEGLDL